MIGGAVLPDSGFSPEPGSARMINMRAKLTSEDGTNRNFDCSLISGLS